VLYLRGLVLNTSRRCLTASRKFSVHHALDIGRPALRFLGLVQDVRRPALGLKGALGLVADVRRLGQRLVSDEQPHDKPAVLRLSAIISQCFFGGLDC
jgi:hypothetical protein